MSLVQLNGLTRGQLRRQCDDGVLEVSHAPFLQGLKRRVCGLELDRLLFAFLECLCVGLRDLGLRCFELLDARR